MIYTQRIVTFFQRTAGAKKSPMDKTTANNRFDHHFNLIFKDAAGRYLKNGRKKGSIKVHTLIHTDERISSHILWLAHVRADSPAPLSYFFSDTENE